METSGNDIVVLITAYSTTGKDTFYRQVTGMTEVPFNWTIYHKPGTNPLNVKSLAHGVRVAFADVLKRMVCERLGIDQGTDLEALKSVVVSDGDTSKTFRQWLIDTGCEYRAIDPDYWCRAALSPTWNTGQTSIVTDWRFPNEMNYTVKNCENVVTVRLFSSTVKESPFGVDHELDNTPTDYLCVRGVDGFREACELFPWYKYYVLQE